MVVHLARANQLDAMPAQAQTVTQPAKRIGHAVDFRWEGFGDQGDM